jgi:hypothetical protein
MTWHRNKLSKFTQSLDDQGFLPIAGKDVHAPRIGLVGPSPVETREDHNFR